MIQMQKRQHAEPSPALAVGPEEAARLLGIGRTQFFRLVRDQKLRVRKIGRRTLVLKVDLETFLQSLPAGG
jgi:excisionase family DNA binding protein